MSRASLLAAILLVLLGNSAFPQALMPSSGSIFATPDDLSPHHMSPLGKPCLALEGSVKAEAANSPSIFGSTASRGQSDKPNALVAATIYEHLITATNSCTEKIKVKVCYYKTDDCIMIDVPSLGRKDAVLGIYPGLRQFRYQAKEQF